MPKEKIKTHRAVLRKIATDVGFDPDDLTASQLDALQKLERAQTSPVRIKKSALRDRAVAHGMNPDRVSMSELSRLIKEQYAEKPVHA